MEKTIVSLKEQYEAFKSENKKTRIREAAKQLGVSEAELVALGENNVALRPEFQEILNEIKHLGKVLAITRNDDAVHERKGVYTKATFNAHIGLVVNPDIDLRLFMNAWHFAFAVEENERKSLQFFDQDGTAVHKIYMTEESNLDVYQGLIEKYKAEDQNPSLNIQPVDYSITEIPDSQADVAGFKAAWLALKDTHQFFGMVKQFGLSRRQALRLAPEGHAVKIKTESLKQILEKVSERDLDIMVFIGSRGCIQIHTGKAKKLLQTGPWYNILDPDFNMHLKDASIESLWIVKKPTEDGIVTSIEAFDQTGNVIAQFFGKRKPRIPEREDWRQVVSEFTEEI